MTSFTKACAIIALGFACIGSYAVAADTVQSLDAEFARTDAELNQELKQATNQIHEAERLNQPSSMANRYGSAADIDARIQATVDQVNDELNRAERQIQATENLGATPIDSTNFRSSFAPLDSNK